MTNKKTTKRALLFSVLSMLLCVTMLMGTTYAWFTDSVSSTNNIIKSGNLDVELKYSYNGTDWDELTPNSQVFDKNDLWEPGFTKVVYLKVSNVGSLALKYQLGVNIVSETEGVNKDGKAFKLSDYIYFGAIEGDAVYATREDARAAVTNAQKISNGYTKSSALRAVNKGVSEETVALVVYMPETVGNEANHNGTDVPEINLGINVVATQYTSEEDSFDKYYDGGATWLGMAETEWYTANPNATEFTIGSSEELAGLAKLVNTGVDSFAGKTIKLVSDLDLNNIEWTPISDARVDDAVFVSFKGTFDGNGHTIKNLYINENSWGMGLFGYLNGLAVIKNVKVQNANVTGTDNCGVIVGYATNGTFSDIFVTGDVSVVGTVSDGHVGGIAGCGYHATFDGCSVVANAGSELVSAGSFVGGIVGYHQDAAKAISNCVVKGLSITGYAAVGGISGIMQAGGTVQLCTVENVDLYKTRVDGIPSIGALVGNYSGTAETSLIKNTVKNVTLNGTHVAYTAHGVLYGSEYSAGTTTTFDLTGTTIENLGLNLVEVKAIKTAAELKNALANSCDNYILTADIAVAKNETITIANGVSATIDLNGHKISSTADKTGNQELFLVKGDLTVKNGSMEYVASNNQGWNSMITIFDVTAGGKLNMEKITANVGGSDMNFIVHLNNWGTATLNVDDCDFTASYVAIRAFNSGYDMNTVTVKNTAFHNGRVFWVHNYTAEGKDDSTLTLDIYGNGNTTNNAKPVRFGFDNEIYYTIDGALIKSATSQAELNSALTGNVSVNLSNGNYTLPAVSNGNATINGTKETVITVNKPAFHGSDLTLNGVTVKGSGYSTGVQHVNTVTYNNATIIGEMCLYGEKVVFNNCTFELNNQYIWTYGAKEVEFNNCTFNTNGKAILVYSENANLVTNVTVEGCTFNATAAAYAGTISNQACAAIEIGSNLATNGHYTLTTSGNTVNGFSGEWRIKASAGSNVTVNGTAYEAVTLDGVGYVLNGKEVTLK